MKIGFFNSIDTTIPLPKGIINAPMIFTKNLAKKLSEKGHQVSLFALKNSRVPGVKIYPLDYKWNRNIKNEDMDWVSHTCFTPKFLNYKLKKDIKKFYNQLAISEICIRQKQFDILHFNYSEIDNIIPFAKLFKTPILIVIHDYITPLRKVVFKETQNFKNIYFVSISASQRKSFKKANFIETIHHGIDVNKFQFNPNPKNYMLFSGRLFYKKGVDAAIKTAQKTKNNLKIIGTINDLDYYNKSIKPYLNKNIQYLGTKYRQELIRFFQNARVSLFPIRWKEPFGLVMIEAMACGTPVIAFNRGSVPEIIKDGKTGFIVKNTDEMIKAVKKIYQMPETEYKKMRYNCRKHVEENFTIEKMVDNYEKVYYEILKKHTN